MSEAKGAMDSDRSDVPRGLPDQVSMLEARFAHMAEILDAAGLGPADYLYAPLKWRLQRPEVSQFLLGRTLWKACKQAILHPPPLPRGLPQSVILAASSYVVSTNLLRQVVTGLEHGEAVLCDASVVTHRPLLRRVADGLRSLLALPPALIFALRVRFTLARAGVVAVERNKIAQAAVNFAMHRAIARAILRNVRPKCLVIGNGNRPFELSLWAEAKARGIATVLLPYAEICLKPARFLSLCRGVFDLVLPLSENSATEMRKLRPDIAVEVVGFPGGFNSLVTNAGVVEKTGSKDRDVLYLGGKNFEAVAAELLYEAFGGCNDLRLRVRLHPRNRRPEARELFSWLGENRIMDPLHNELAADIASSAVVISIRSTAAIDAMIAGVPLVWISPRACREELELDPIRTQKLALLEATTSLELRAIIRKLLDDDGERQHVVEEQWSRLRAAGYDRDYFGAVRSAVRRLVGIDVPNTLARLGVLALP